MSFFIKYRTNANHPWKAINRVLYSTYRQASFQVRLLAYTQYGEFAVGDADHEPDRSVLTDRHGFS